MMRDPDTLTLFDDRNNDHQDLEDVAWECAYQILSAGGRRSKVPREDTQALSDDLLRWCHPRERHGEHWTPEQQMRWLADHVRDNCGRPPSTKDLRHMVLDKFNPAPPTGDTFEVVEYKKAKWRADANCKRCIDSGIDDKTLDFCTCTRGEATRERARREESDVKTSRLFGPRHGRPASVFCAMVGYVPRRDRRGTPDAMEISDPPNYERSWTMSHRMAPAGMRQET